MQNIFIVLPCNMAEVQNLYTGNLGFLKSYNVSRERLA